MGLLLNPQTRHIYQNYAETKLEVIYFDTIIFIVNVIIFKLCTIIIIIFKLSTMIMFYFLIWKYFFFTEEMLNSPWQNDF